MEKFCENLIYFRLWAIREMNADIYIDKMQFPHARKPIWNHFFFFELIHDT